MVIQGLLAALVMTLAGVGVASFFLMFAMIMKDDSYIEGRTIVTTIIGTFLLVGAFAFSMLMITGQTIRLW